MRVFLSLIFKFKDDAVVSSAMRLYHTAELNAIVS